MDKMDKDNCHDTRVTSVGEVSYPLVVKMPGLWSPDSLDTLKSIALKVLQTSNYFWVKNFTFFASWTILWGKMWFDACHVVSIHHVVYTVWHC